MQKPDVCVLLLFSIATIATASLAAEEVATGWHIFASCVFMVHDMFVSDEAFRL